MFETTNQMWIDDEEWDMTSRIYLGYRGMSRSTFGILVSTKGLPTNVDLDNQTSPTAQWGYNMI